MSVAPRPLPAAGLVDPVFDSQRIFRGVLEVLSKPGRIVSVSLETAPPSPLNGPAAAIALSLFDGATPVWLAPELATEEVKRYLGFHTGCPITADPTAASFAIAMGSSREIDLDKFNPGTAEYPDRSTTLILQISGLSNEHGTTLEGPGIESQAVLAVEGVGDDFWRMVQFNATRYPLGVDLLFAAPDRIAGLPRSTRVES